MDYIKGQGTVIVRLDDGDEIVESIKKICKEEKIQSAHVSAIGAAKKVEISHYNTIEKKYNVIKLQGMLEIVSLSGNVSILNNEPNAHLHIILSMEDYSTRAGHLMKAEAYPTCEIVILPLGAKIERVHDDKTGLNLMAFKS
ncbi:DNA-binding protein [Candidatus Micrarchaeota archaeon]|nr:DNA-binding protein [Candidatus Micrarchaeota archaeon]